ncbi:MAG: ATP-binding protein [Chloroflexota bacterium]
MTTLENLPPQPDPDDERYLPTRNDDDDLVFAPASPSNMAALPQDRWTILIVDDEPEVHTMTEVALRGFVFAEKPVELISAQSGEEAKTTLANHSDIALILLDVVMETPDSGLQLVRYIREELQNHLVQIVLRTGQPGQVPEESVIVNYNINDYKTKMELTHEKFITTIITALRSYESLVTIESNRQLLAEQAKVLEEEVAERKKAQAELLIARDEAVAANEFKTELLGKVSHELRTPIGAILGYCEMMTEGLYGDLSEEQNETVATVIDSAQYLITLVGELLDQSQLEAGRMVLNVDLFYPQFLLDQIQKRMALLAQEKNLTLTAELDSELPEMISGDINRLQQVLVNLVENGIKFTETGEVKVALRLVDADHWAMQVSDTGLGIPAEDHTHIFDPFGQVDGSPTRLYSGAGLGLSLVKQLTALMGGQVSLESEVGQGSTFTILLPLDGHQASSLRG